MITKKDLQNYVDKMNEKYCKRTKNYLRVGCAYGGYQVQLTGKPYKNKNKWHGLGSGCTDITYGFNTARNTLNELYKADSQGWLKNKIKAYEG